MQLNLLEFVKILRARWITVLATLLVAVIAAIVITLATTPLYQASTRLFVSTTSGVSVTDIYQGNLFSQERVKSYTELLMGETLAERTIEKLGLDMTPAALQKKVKATSKLDTVLIDVQVRDESPVRARDIANALSDEFVELVAELETPKAGAIPDSRVVVEQRASIPNTPVVPKVARNIAIGVVFGVVLGIAFAVIRDLLDNAVKRRETLEEITGVGLVGTIPLDRERRKRPPIAFDRENSAISEAFRKLRTNLQFLAVDNPPRLIAITSSAPHEGKSTTAINIALALAEAEHSVCLVDGDMRRPSLDKYLGLVGSVGFSTVLSGGTTLSDALQETPFPQLTVLTSGPIPPNPSELLGSTTAKKVLAELRSRFDYVIVDSSPLLAVTDGALLSANADGALIMVRFGETKRDQLAHAVRNLEDVDATLLGAVITMLPTRGSAPYAYNYSYTAGYGDLKVPKSSAVGANASPSSGTEDPADADILPAPRATEAK